MNKKTEFILAVLVVFLVVVQVSAEERFYAKLEINEVKFGNTISFSLAGATAEYGEYDNFYDVYKEDSQADYILEAYNSQKELTAKYSLKSARFTYWDGQTSTGEPTGGINESASGVMNIYIPYDRAEPTAYIKIDNKKGVKTGLISLPTSQLEDDFKKIPLCIKENEAGTLNTNRCCSGLMPKLNENSNFICVNCGNKICEKNEDITFCSEDCAVSPSPEIQTLETGKSNLPVLTVVLSIIGLILLAFLAFKAIKSMKSGM